MTTKEAHLMRLKKRFAALAALVGAVAALSTVAFADSPHFLFANNSIDTSTGSVK